MSLFMKDPKKLATLIVENAELTKKPQTSDGAEKDVSIANNDQAGKLLAAFQSQDKEAFMSSLRSFIRDVMHESKDEKPTITSGVI